MAQDDLHRLHDTYAALQRAQLEREKLTKETERKAAGKVLEHYAERHDWSQEDVTEVRMALGLGGLDEQEDVN